MERILHVWRFTDGKRGHENQTRGLVAGLQSLFPLQEHIVQCGNATVRPFDWIRKRFPPGADFPPPDFLVGAGRRTHWPLLVAQRATGAPTVVLMAPAPWLRRRFDLCLVPEHDGLGGANVELTRGALTPIRPGGEHSAGRGVLLIGGPSSHHDWDGPSIVAAVREIVERSPTRHWKLTTSRRTPPETTRALQGLTFQNLAVEPAERTGPDWVPTELAASGAAWVTEDSVSMVYESLTAGAITGVLPVPRKRTSSRVIRGLDQLVEGGFVSRFDPTSPSATPMQTNARTFDEAARCAEIIARRFFPDFPRRHVP